MIGSPPDLPGLAPGGRPSPRAWGKFKRHFWGRSLRHQQGEPNTLALLIRWVNTSATQGIFHSGSSSSGD
jgi:hypothetical protein